MAGWPAGRLEELKVRLTQPSLAGTGAELGNIKFQNRGLGISKSEVTKSRSFEGEVICRYQELSR